MNEIFDAPVATGGERQRISIAWALLKNAPIVLLDEATASLDVENETRVQGAPAELLASNGTFARMVRLQSESANWAL